MPSIKTTSTSLPLSYKLVSILVVLFFLFPIKITLAQSDSDLNLDTVISGFEDSEPNQQNNELDDILSDFEKDFPDEPLSEQSDDTESSWPAWIEIKGDVGLGSSINFAHDAPPPGRTDHRGLSRLKVSFDLLADYRFSSQWQARTAVKTFYDFAYRINGYDNYTEEVLDLYEYQALIDDFYIQGNLSQNLDVKIGRQVVAWGKSDHIRVTDILNPIDNREPGLVDIGDLRLPVTMTKLDYFFGKWNLSPVVVHEIRFNKNPVFDNDFFPADQPLPPEEKPSTSLQNQEFGLSMNGIFSGWDLSFYGAYVFNDQTHLEMSASGLKQKHARITLAGLSTNIASGNWIFKCETAYRDGLQFFTQPEPKNRLDMLLGAEYYGFSDTIISFEAVNRHLFEYDDLMNQVPDRAQENEFQSVFRITKDFWYDKLTVSALFATFGLTGEDGAFQRFTCEYDWSDDLSIGAGLITYQSGDTFIFSDIGDNDRIFIEIRYNFGS